MSWADHCRCSNVLEPLEGRTLLSFNPTAAEQQMLEMLNRMRMNPGPELDLLLNANDADINQAIDDYNVNITNLQNQWTQLDAVAPVAWNEALYKAARGHSLAMLTADAQAHDLPGELEMRDRISAQGYTDQSWLGENVYAYATSVLHSHAAFAIDWGDSPSGIQQPPGHRLTMMDADPQVPVSYREIGIGILKAPAGTRETGPYLVTQDFGGPTEPGNAYLLGTVRQERNANGFYDIGEGIGGVRMTITGTGGTFRTYTLSAGAYQVRVPAGTYTVTAAEGLTERVVKTNVVVGSDNVKVDILGTPDVYPPKAAVASAAAVGQAGARIYSFAITYTDQGKVKSSTLGTGEMLVYNSKGFKVLAKLISRTPVGDSNSIRAIYRIQPPGGSWDYSDNGTYVIRLLGGHVKDILGNTARTRNLGAFTVSIARTRKARSLTDAPRPITVLARDLVAAPIPTQASPRRTAEIAPTGVFSTRRVFDGDLPRISVLG